MNLLQLILSLNGDRRVLFVFAAGIVTFSTGFSAHGQGTFQNLDFEAAQIIPILPVPFPQNLVATSNALPGWSASEPIIPYNTISLGAAAISIHDQDDVYHVFEGKYSVLLQQSFNGLVSPSLWQVGAIPEGSKSLRYLGGVSSVTFDGHPLEFVSLGPSHGTYLLGADISEFAGQAGELRFSGDGWLDLIGFSPEPIPEPSPAALHLLVGGFAFLRLRVRQKA